MPQYCAVPGCKDSGGFKFPSDQQVCLQWRVAIKREGLRKSLWKPSDRSVVCSKHFSTEDFLVPLQSYVALGGRVRRNLKPGVVPSLSLPHNVRDEQDAHAAEGRRQRVNRRRGVAEGPVPEEEPDLMDISSLEPPINPPPVIFEELEPELSLEVMSESVVSVNIKMSIYLWLMYAYL
jgi:hypothetical protein